ncbi:hypothetical protein K449DRAFT_464325 [Hypoxylon sp. EC38]|nr:hypothetical protein K449DRAFT_464325 [Hypoxylon sp. EC38]
MARLSLRVALIFFFGFQRPDVQVVIVAFCLFKQSSRRIVLKSGCQRSGPGWRITSPVDIEIQSPTVSAAEAVITYLGMNVTSFSLSLGLGTGRSFLGHLAVSIKLWCLALRVREQIT